ncbi:MAG: hypothetical protein EOO85_33300 [Pedobacter sp.]|nr:MAG: hypothetical protein EOO85_33300 [Pedobacter sp.]
MDLIHCFELSKENRVYEDPLILVEFRRARDKDLGMSKVGINTVTDWIEYNYKRNFDSIINNISPTFEGHHRHIPVTFFTKIKSNLFNELITYCSPVTWVEIENVYYGQLKRIFEGYKSNVKLDAQVKQLNDDFAHLISKLQEYLCTIKPKSSDLNYKAILESPFIASDFTSEYPKDTSIGDTMILNFNYTNTVNQYLGPRSQNINLNFIHGELKNIENPIIFGFGDEMDDIYSQFETHKTMGQFDYFKSFLYLQTSNYYNLLRFIQSNNYQVYILGHSCGLSDRTMLNMIMKLVLKPV